MTDPHAIGDFLFELGMLGRIHREGWKLLGMENPETVARHSLRAAQIGYILAHLEGYENPEEVCSILVFHDIGECRIGDIHKVANRYVQVTEKQVVKDQTDPLNTLGEHIFSLWKQMEYKDTQAGIIAKDADLLDVAVTAREYQIKGYSEASQWFENVRLFLETNSGKKLYNTLSEMNPNTWWQGLKKL